MRVAKPRIPESTIAKWQRVVDLSAELMDVPASLVMRTDPPEHAVLISSKGDDNPYRVGQTFELNPKLYCYSVLERCDELTVRDAYAEAEWNDNQDLEHGMTFYVGYPLVWPDGSVFGTICILDKQDNEKALACRELLKAFRGVIEGDLELLEEAGRRMQAENELQVTLEQLEQRVANRTRELEEANTALRVLLSNVESSRAEFEEKILRQINGLVLPHIAKLRLALEEGDPASAYLDLLEANLGQITSSFAGQLVTAFEALTPTESEIAQLILNGQTTKDIARALSRETSTIDFHRNNIRKKLGIEHRSINLRRHLMSLQ